MIKKELLESTLIINEELNIKSLINKVKSAIKKFKIWLTDKILSVYNKIILLLKKFKKVIIKENSTIINEAPELKKTHVNIRTFLLNLRDLKKLIFRNIQLLTNVKQNSQEILSVSEEIKSLIDVSEIITTEDRYFSEELIDASIQSVQQITRVLRNQLTVLNAYKLQSDKEECSLLLTYIDNTTKMINDITIFCSKVVSKIVV